MCCVSYFCQVFDYRKLAYPDLPEEHPKNHHPSGVNQWPKGELEFRCDGTLHLQASRSAFAAYAGYHTSFSKLFDSLVTTQLAVGGS